MWTSKVNFSDLCAKEKWKVELFTNSKKESHSIYDMVPLKDIVQERKENFKPLSKPEESFNYIGLENIKSMTGELINFTPKLGKEIKSSTKKFYESDILYGKLRPYLNKVYLSERDAIEAGICSSEFYVLIPDYSKVLPNYLRLILSSSYIQDYVNSMQTGSTLPRININDLLNIKIPIPPINVQEDMERDIIKRKNRIKKITKELDLLPKLTISEVEKVVKGI